MSQKATFDLCVGIDYSGGKTSTSRSATLQVYTSDRPGRVQVQKSPAASSRVHRNWNRREIAEWIVSTVLSGQTLIAGIDHGFSFPIDYLRRYELTDWHDFLTDFCQHWPSRGDAATVDSIRKSASGPPNRVGGNTELRLCEKWTPSAKSVFLFDVQGSVAKSTHAGIPWLQFIRDQVGDRVHFWPFDGWVIPEGKSVLAEVFPSIFRRRYPSEDRSVDQHDAYSVACWLQNAVSAGTLSRYFDPPLNAEEREIARHEGWILGVC